MHIFTFNLFKINKAHYFNVFDKKGRLFKVGFGVLALLYFYCVAFPVPNEYRGIIESGSKYQGVDNLFDYTVPLMGALFVFYSFLPDYKNKIHELFRFYGSGTYNSIILYRWLFLVGFFSIGTVASHMMYFRNLYFLEWQSVWMAVSKLPNLFMLCSIILFFMSQFKNAYIGLFVMLAYYVFDYISVGRTLAYMSLGAHSNNFYYEYSPTLYIVNRLVLVSISIILLLLASRKHSIFRLRRFS